MMNATIRPFGAEDFGGVLRLWQEQDWRATGPDGLTLDQAIELLRAEGAIAVIAETNGEVSGAGLGTVVGPTGWIFRLAASTEADLGALVSDLEARLAEGGARRVVAFAPDTDCRAELERREYRSFVDAHYFERSLPGGVVAGTALADAGGRLIAPGLWAELRGMEDAKEIIERRVILPLERPELADRHGVVSPKAIILFGPRARARRRSRRGSLRGSSGRSSKSSPRRSAAREPSARRSSSPRASHESCPWRRLSSSSTRSRTSPRSDTSRGR
jgi:hypothetical protein